MSDSVLLKTDKIYIVVNNKTGHKFLLIYQGLYQLHAINKT
jgi:hypothetical protein